MFLLQVLWPSYNNVITKMSANSKQYGSIFQLSTFLVELYSFMHQLYVHVLILS